MSNDSWLLQGTIDIEEATIAPQKVKNFTSEDYWGAFRSDVVSVQLFSDDISDTVDFALEISEDGTNWGAATDGNGDAITGTLTVDVPYVNVFGGAPKLKYRISFTVVAQTGNISYIFRQRP